MESKKSQLRQDLVSGDWLVIASGRGENVAKIIKNIKKRKIASKATCPFENPQKSGNEEPIMIYHSSAGLEKTREWKIQIIKNRYPAFLPKSNNGSINSKKGPYSVMQAIGHHDLLITRDHNKNFADLSLGEAVRVFEAFRDRYLMLFDDSWVSYVSMFHNWGASAGASVYHPHYQIIAIPVIPPDVEHSLEGSQIFFNKNKKCVHCVMIEDEIRNKHRVIYENKEAIAFAPFFSKEPFEVRVFPKKHLPYFENTQDYNLESVVEALQYVLKKVKKNLNDADYNFFIHTAPVKDKDSYNHYHWHIEVIPKITLDAGFELSTGIEINVVDPDDAAKILKK